MNRHLISAADLSREDALLILDTADELARVADRPIKKLPTLRGRTVVNLFFEDSTRTRISFEAAAKRLSADVINFSAKGSSVAKGESLKDTALTLEAMGADAVVVRHSASGAPHRLAELAARQRDQRRGRRARAPDPGAARRVHDPPAVRAQRPGDGTGEALDGLRVTIVGDVLHSRVARSNVWLLHTLGAEVALVAPPTLLPVAIDAWPCSVSYDLDADAAQERRGDDAADPAGAHERRLLPQRPRVQPPLRARRRAAAAASRRGHRDAPRPDEPRGGDRRGGGRLAPVHDRRAGRQRRQRPDGRALPAARRRPGGDLSERRPAVGRSRGRGRSAASPRTSTSATGRSRPSALAPARRARRSSTPGA